MRSLCFVEVEVTVYDINIARCTKMTLWRIDVAGNNKMTSRKSV